MAESTVVLPVTAAAIPTYPFFTQSAIGTKGKTPGESR
jgi:hypothetical protein